MAIKKPKHILVAPLDWGLGHTTRCVPLISHILTLGHIPVFAGNDAQRSFIQEIFGPLDCIHLDGYNITYSGWNKLAHIGLLSQLPGIKKTIRSEHLWLQQIAAGRVIHGIISDNRYGLYHPRIPSVILTHQLQVRTGFGALPDRAVREIHYSYLNRFTATWVADTAGPDNLGCALSHAARLPLHTTYLGLLSCFSPSGPASPPDSPTAPLLVLLSGPEPQRSHLSARLWQQVLDHNGPVVFADGSLSAPRPATIPAHISYHSRVSGSQLHALISEAGMVICRSGYSTLMDLVALGKKAILIPTPGQTEQQYLARHLHQQGVFLSARQARFHLPKALAQARQFPWHKPGLQQCFTAHMPVLENWINSL